MSETVTWHRYPVGDTHKAHYVLRDGDGNQLGFVRWCGHPTATYPYFTHDAADRLRTFRNVRDAKAFVERGAPAFEESDA